MTAHPYRAPARPAPPPRRPVWPRVWCALLGHRFVAHPWTAQKAFPWATLGHCGRCRVAMVDAVMCQPTAVDNPAWRPGADDDGDIEQWWPAK